MKSLYSLFVFSVLTASALHTAAQVGINTTGNAPDNSSILDVSATDKGLLIPRMTTVERDAIANPASGLMIVNTTTQCLEIWFAPMWQSIYCGCSAPAAPVAGVHAAQQDEITWNWSSSNTATGYKYNTVNDYGTATDNGNTLSYTQSGLACNTPATLYVWAYSACGVSPVTQLSQTSEVCFTCGISSIYFTYKGSQVAYGTVVGQNGRCWLDRNLGAAQQATSVTDAQAYGDLFQWGRLDDGHQTPSSPNLYAVSSTDDPGNGSFMLPSGMPWDWRSPQNNNLWQGVNGINNPCPAGWRLPTDAEFNTERASWSPQSVNGAYASALKFPASGLRSGANGNGVLYGQGSYGYCWTSGVSNEYGGAVYYDSSAAIMNPFYRANAGSVRCTKD